ncbi:MAG TPA: sulfatase-like hydrolase/transferase [Thermoanaerobaculia bacterium]|nr:sulfatase-like hydrolase/transferase [Thermoanaerobaculia bacterium]
MPGAFGGPSDPRLALAAGRAAVRSVPPLPCRLLGIAGALLLAAAMGCAPRQGAAGGAAGRQQAEAPRGSGANLLLVTLDTVRADHLGCYGDAAAETPALDRLAAEGVRFAHASTAAPLTLPSHTTLLTGLLPPHHGTHNNGVRGLSGSTPTLATLLAGAGYRTAAFVAAFVLDHRFGLERGFEVYDDEIERPANASWLLEAERPGDQVVDRALAWLEREDPRPFFLWVHLYDAHAPYNPPSPYRERHPGRPYDGAIAFADAQVGRLLAALERRGLAAGTVVAVVADHGESLGEHGELTHGLLLYEPALAVPLLLRAPGLAPRSVATPVSTVDLAPTLAGLLRRRWTRDLDGRDLSAALLAGQEPAAGEIYAETRYPEVFGWAPLTSLRRRELKYIAAPHPELYDLARDPVEARNLVEPAPADTARGFAVRLAAIAASAATASAARPAAAPDEDTRRRLASLGYVAAAGPVPGAPAAGALAAGATRDLLDPKQSVALFQRFQQAHAALQAGRTAAALAELAPLVAADPGNPVFRSRLAQTLSESGQVERAIALYRDVTKLTPRDSEAWYNLAGALEEAGHLAAARSAIAKAIELDPGRPEAHNTLGLVCLAEGKPEQARQEFASAAAADPRNAHALNNLGNVLRALGRPGEAEQSYRRAVAVAPHYADPWNGLGTLEVDRDHPAAALPYFERAIALAPRNPEARLNRAIAFQLAGRREAAIAAYRDFLAGTGEQPQLATQRRAARQLLAQLTAPARARAVSEHPEGRR